MKKFFGKIATMILCIFLFSNNFILGLPSAKAANTSITVPAGQEVSLFSSDLGYEGSYAAVYFESVPSNGGQLGYVNYSNAICAGCSYFKSDVDNGMIKFRAPAEGVFHFKVRWQSGRNVPGTKVAPYTEEIIITITALNPAPTDISLNNTKAPGGFSGFRIANLRSTDYNNDHNTFSIHNDPDSLFEIVTVNSIQQLRLMSGKFLAAGETATVGVRATDSANNTYDETFTIKGVMAEAFTVAPNETYSFTWTGDIVPESETLPAELGYVVIPYEGTDYPLPIEVWKDDTVKYTTPSTSGTDTFIIGDKYYVVTIENTTPTDSILPVVGNSGTITNSNLSTVGVTLSWTKATDNATSEGDLEYQVYQSSSNNISNLSDIEVGNGTALGTGFVKDITSFNVTGLNPGETYYFNVIVRDAAGNKSTYTMQSITTPTLNQAPTDISLSNSTVNQSSGTNAVVGTFSTTDDSGSYTYSLVNGDGDTNNSLFNISNSDLRTNNTTAMTPGTYSVRVRTTDNSGLTFEKDFTITLISSNTAPMIKSGDISLPLFTSEDVTSNPILIRSILLGADYADEDSGAFSGVAISSSQGAGTWEYSMQDGTVWNELGTLSETHALLLSGNSYLRYVPNGKFGETATVEFRAWDQTDGSSEGSYQNITTNGGQTAFSANQALAKIVVSDVNDAPVLVSSNPTLTSIREDDRNNSGQSVFSFLGLSVTDVDSGAQKGIAITSKSGTGTWQFSTDGGAVWTNIGQANNNAALLLYDTNLVRFIPGSGSGGSTASLGYRAWDRTVGSVGGTMDISVNGGNTPFSVASDTATIHIQNIYTITFDKNGGDVDTNPVSKTALPGGSVGTLPSEPTRVGYKFMSWNTESNGSGDTFTPSTEVMGDQTVYAQWTPNTYEVTFNPIGGQVTSSSQIKLYDSIYGKGANGTSSDSLPIPTRVGYDFSGWFTQTGGAGVEVTNTTLVNTASDHTLYAHWTAKQYTVTFDAGDGEITTTSQSKLFGSMYGKGSNGTTDDTLPTPTRHGYNFAGWYSQADGAGVEVTNTTPVNMASDHTLYAHWTAKPYTVTFDAGDGTVTTTTQTKLFGSTYGKGSDGTSNESLPVPTRTGYAFVGWYDNNGFTGSAITNQSEVTIANNHTLYAKWEVNYYNVTYNANGSTGGFPPNVTSHAYGSVVTVSGKGDLEKTGYTFTGWNAEANGSGTPYAASTAFPMGTNHVTLYAQWIANTYDVTFDAGGGNVTPTIQTKLYDSTYGKQSDGSEEVLPIPTKVGYDFVGWYSQADGAGVEVTNITPVNIPSDHTLYAHWTAKPYTVTFDAGDGTVTTTTQTKLFGSTYGKGSDGTSNESLPTPTRTGYAFAGWYDNDGFTGSAITNQSEVTIANNHTLYAKWEVNSYNVTYNANGSTGGFPPNVTSHAYGSVVTVSGKGDLEKTGYTFTGWNAEANGSGTPYAASTAFPMGTNHVTLYAQWIANTYDVTFDAGGGNVTPTIQTKLYDSTYGKQSDGSEEVLPIPTK
ncbi:InlB B-repeat-containing protein, partial [Cytobacillus sp. FJAT-54145]